MKKLITVLLCLLTVTVMLVSCTGVKVDSNVKDVLAHFFTCAEKCSYEEMQKVLSPECNDYRRLYKYFKEIDEEKGIVFKNNVGKVIVTEYDKKTCVGYTEYTVSGIVGEDEDVSFKIELIGDEEGTKITHFSFKLI